MPCTITPLFYRLTYNNVHLFDTATHVILTDISACILTTVIVGRVSSGRAFRHLGSVPNLNSQTSNPIIARDESLHIIFENRSLKVISLNEPRGMSAKMVANGVRHVAFGFAIKLFA